jgi:hypothetical protein
MYVEGESAQLHLTLAKILEEGTYVPTCVRTYVRAELCEDKVDWFKILIEIM